MDFQDKIFTCVDCKKEFTHSAADQRSFAERGFNSEPKRCPDCRKARKEKHDRPRGHTAYGLSPVGGMSGGRGGRGGDRPDRGGGWSGGGWSEGGHRGEGGGGGGFGGGPRPSFEAVCAACGQKTTVPFEPTQGRDVYCRDCFRKTKGTR